MSESMDTNVSQSSLIARASTLVSKLASEYLGVNGNGSFSVSVYDTAWIAMICRTVNGETYWMFPEAFQYLLNNQSLKGSWNEHFPEVDGILSSAAALLALKKHKIAPLCSNSTLPDNIDIRIARATSSLRSQLQQWDVEGSDHVGFEILVPSMLDLLEQEGIRFEFGGRSLLSVLNAQKVAKFHPQLLYGTEQSTLLHSLEALTNQIDFDNIKHHMTAGNMMASPASTAMYLMQSSAWDDHAEAYLRRVLASSPEHGAVPSAFPTNNFELTWTVSTLLESGFTAEELGLKSLERIADFLLRQLAVKKGVLGFAPNVLADADDTAKAILCMCLLGRPISPDTMIATFESDSHFRTYVAERNPSFSANCNILIALLHLPSPTCHYREICKAAKFVCDAWYAGPVMDKWNTSSQYSMMLLAQALTRLLRVCDAKSLNWIFESWMEDRIPVVLLQVLIRTLQTQDADGSWRNGSLEITAYAVLTLSSVVSLPWARSILPHAEQVFKAGRDYLLHNARYWSQAEHVWIEKVSYGSIILSEAYCMAAAKSSTRSLLPWGDAVEAMSTSIPFDAVKEYQQFFARLPIFSGELDWKLTASVLEGYLFLPRLRSVRLDIFPGKQMAEDKYLAYIPFTWTALNNLQGAPLYGSLLWDMMVVSMLNYQADEYMESVVGEQFGDDLESIKLLIKRLCSEPDRESESSDTVWPSLGDEKHGNGILTPQTSPVSEDAQHGQSPKALTDVETVLTRFTTFILQHPKVLQALPSAQRHLRRELATFLLAHITHASDNTRFASQPHAPNTTTQFSTPKGTYFDWVRTTSADHTSCPYAFAFYSCLIAKPAKGCFRGVKQTYLAQDLCRHLATMCRQYNDYGSMARDRAERNLNSINFPEFGAGVGEVGGDVETRLKEDLLWIAEYERECLGMVVKRLEGMVGAKVREALGVFVGVTDLFGQIYVARDIGIRMKGV